MSKDNDLVRSGPRVAFIIPTLQGGGAECVVSRLSMYLAQYVSVTVVTWDGIKPAYHFGGELVNVDLPASPSWFVKPFRQQERCKALVGIIRQRGITHAIAFMEASAIPLAMVKKNHLPDVVATVSMRCSPDSLGLIAKYQIRKWYPFVDHIVMQTNESALRVSGWGIPSSKCVVTPNPLPEDYLRQMPPFSERDKDLVISVGRLDPVKNFKFLLDVFASLRVRRSLRLVILGDGPMRSALNARAKVLGIADRVEFPGRTEAVRDWLDRAALFVMTSRHEGFPNALAEAMARGCPVISTDCPMGPREMIEHGRSGWLVPVGDVAALRNAMTEALIDRRRAEQFGRLARQRAEKWAIDCIAPQWLKGL